MKHSRELISRNRQPRQRFNFLISKIILFKLLEYSAIIAPHHITTIALLAIPKPTLGSAHMPNLLQFHILQYINFRHPLIIFFASKNIHPIGNIHNTKFHVADRVIERGRKWTVLCVEFDAWSLLVFAVTTVEEDRGAGLENTAGRVGQGAGGWVVEGATVVGGLSEFVQLFEADVELFVVLFLYWVTSVVL